MFTAEQLQSALQVYYWPFLRFSGLLLAAPLFGASSVPVQVRVVLALFIAALIAPALPAMPEVDMLGAEGWLLTGEQLLIGLSMGFILQMTFSAFVIAGQSMAMTMGLGFAMTVDPQNGVQVPVLSQLYVILSTLIFLATDSHLIMLGILADSFQVLPVGLANVLDGLPMAVVVLASQMFLGALLIALPTLAALLLINIAFGVITRAAPQLNIFAVGFPVTILAGFVLILLSMPTTIALFVNMFESTLAAMMTLVG